MTVRNISFADAVQEALDCCLGEDENVFVIGEGVPDPKGIFGTTLGLQDKYGVDRVMDMQVSENGMTGVCIGAAINGFRPVMVHQRIDFALLAMDQIINNAAKWRYMFNGQWQVPLVIRLILGRGWGQGPQHAQSLQALFAHIPGLKVVMPVTPYDAKGMLIAAVRDNDPVIFIEHRWLHGISGDVPMDVYEVPLDSVRIARNGSDITLAATSYMVFEAMRAAEVLSEHGIECEVVDLRTLRPFNPSPLVDSVRKTGRLLVADTSQSYYGVSAEVIASVMEQPGVVLKTNPRRIGNPDHPVPTSHFQADAYYPDAETIGAHCAQIFDLSRESAAAIAAALHRPAPRDVPNRAYTGPF